MLSRRRRRILITASTIAILIALGIAVWQDWLNSERTAAIAALLSLATAAAAWEATARASDIAETLATIERDRWHTELTPNLDVEIRRPSAGARATLKVTLQGPAALERLDGIIVTVRDDGLDRTPLTPPPPTVEDVAQQIWGPLHFIPGIDGVTDPGRATPSFALELGDYRPFDMRNTQPPPWQEDSEANARWRDEYRNQTVRLKIECRREGHKPWFIHKELPIHSIWAEL